MMHNPWKTWKLDRANRRYMNQTAKLKQLTELIDKVEPELYPLYHYDLCKERSALAWDRADTIKLIRRYRA